MAVSVTELLALPFEERAKLAEALWESVAPGDLEPLIREMRACMEQAGQSLEATAWRLQHLDAELERNREEIREALRGTAPEWPFAVP